MTLHDQILGCVVGGAIGDAMGGAYEGCPAPVRVDSRAPWSISDDTQLCLATCEAITRSGGVKPEDIARRFLEWFCEGRFSGVGASTLSALRALDAGVHWMQAGRRGDLAAGNGAAVRAAPMSFWLDPDSDADRTLLDDVCRITHQNDEAYAGALAMVAAVRTAGGESGYRSLAQVVCEMLPDSRLRDRLFVIAHLDPSVPTSTLALRYGASGYVVESVPLAIHSAEAVDHAGFEATIISAIEAGGDTDTTAAMTGQIAGARVGLSGIPRELWERLPGWKELRRTAQAFADAVERR